MTRKRRSKAGKRYPLNMRTTRELRERIEDAARLSGRSLVQEVEYRLEQSIQREEAAQVERALMARDATDEEVGVQLVTLAALGGPAGRIASMAAVRTEEGKAAAVAALARYKRDVQHYQESPPDLEREIFKHAAKTTEGES